MDEDCLTLNIWAPPEDGKKHAVMLFLHGGSFCDGAGSDPEYEGSKLAREGGVVLVTINYRLGALGFMDFSFLDESFSPNCGLTDIAQAIKWVHANIGAFSGDPDNITVFGQSAGATCCSVLPMMPGVRDCIAKIIMMSGGPTLLHDREAYQELGKRFLDFVGIDDADTLRNIPAARLIARQKEFSVHSGLGAGTFALEADGDIVPGHPIPMAARGEMGRIPMQIGTTREEMSFVFFRSLRHIIDIRGVMGAGVAAEDEAVRARIAGAYARGGRRGRKRMISDMVFRMPCVWFAGVYGGHADTWMYRFDYETAAMRISGLHAFHSSDIPFVFGNYKAGLAKLMFIFSPVKRAVARLSREIRDDFLRFAKTGALPWEKCGGTSAPAKCYARKCAVKPAVPPEVAAAYNGSNFHTRSMGGESNFT